MNSMFVSAAAIAASPSVAPAVSRSDAVGPLVAAARLLLADLERGRTIDAQALRTAMIAAFGASDSEGAWTWKTAYDACEAAQVLFLRKFGRAMRARAESPSAFLAMLAKVAALLPSHTRRSEESQALQQFSTPIALGFVACVAAAITPADIVLEPSAGTGLLAIHAELAGGSLVLNELADTRAGLLDGLFPSVAVTRHDAAQIHDHLAAAVCPIVVLMNPPFSVAAHVDGRVADAALRHISSALARLAEGGRLVAITGSNLSPDNLTWRDAFVRIQQRGRIVFSAAVDGRVYARHGTNVDTRLTIIDRVPADDPSTFPESPGIASDTATLLEWVSTLVPVRSVAALPPAAARAKAPTATRPTTARRLPNAPSSSTGEIAEPTGVELEYESVDWAPGGGGRITEALYEGYALQSVRIPGSQAHPTRLVQSAAMASVAPPKPTYRPHLPAIVISEGLLSDAQLESVIYAGEAYATGLRLTDGDGSLREDLPPITTFLNRLLALTIDLQNVLFGVFEDLLRTKIEGAIASGTYDLGVETVTAESLIITDRRSLYVHPETRAQTSVFTITRRDRNRPFTLDQAFDRADDPRARLLVNSQSGRAAVEVPAPSLMRDDGTVEPRVRLLRPMERPAIALSDLAHTHWQEADRAEFVPSWEAEIAAVPEFTDSTLYIVTGLLLPIWKRLPNESMRVYRLQTDDGERVIGRLVSPAWVAQAVDSGAPTLSPTDAFAVVLDGRTLLQLQDGLELRRAKVMGEFRIELSGFSDGMVERLKAIGLLSEIISWKLRLFVPTSASGPGILAKVMERHPLVRIADKAAA